MKHIFIVLSFVLFEQVIAQPTVGLQTYDAEKSFAGLTLFDPINDPNAYLIDNCGKLVHTWQSDYNPRLSTYLLDNGNLLRACRGGAVNPDFNSANPVGRVEILDWNSNVLWSYTFSNDTLLQHHDIEPMPNGNILILTWAMMTEAEAIQAGRNPSLLPDGMLWPDQIIEVEPVGTDQINEVWRWRFHDHVIQDFDASKDNYGVVADHPELLDINYVNNNGAADWIHGNSIAYHAERDEIVISSRKMSEIYVIDHSTTTAEASSNAGGNHGKGGDFIYRWGNPQVYDQGTSTNRQLFGQHDAHWVPAGYPDEDKIIIFNNGRNRTPFEYSTVDIIDPPVNGSDQYEYDGTSYGPASPSWTYENVGLDTLFASFISGAHQLPNGNVLFCDGPAGTLYEVNSTGEIGWKYVIPVNGNGPMTQGTTPTGNNTFRARRYALDYPGLVGNLTSGDPIELNPTQDNCFVEYLGMDEQSKESFLVFPNPTTGILNFTDSGDIIAIEIYNCIGALVHKASTLKNGVLNVSHLKPGIYHLVVLEKSQRRHQNVIINR